MYGVNLPSVNTPGKIIPGPEGRLQYINQLSSTSGGALVDIGTAAAADGKALVWCSTCGTTGKFVPKYVSSATQIISLLDEGVYQVKGATINCVGAGVTCSGAASDVLTINVPGGGGATSNVTKPFQVVWGTFTAVGVDTGNANSTGFAAALALCGSAGLVRGSTAACSIAMQPGLYYLNGTTVPENVSLYGVPGSSTIIVATNTAMSVMWIYGRAEGLTFDLGQLNFTGQMVATKGSGQLVNSRIVGANNQNPTQAGSCALCVIGSSNTTAIKNVEMRDVLAQPGINIVGDLAPFMMSDSTNTTIDGLTISTITPANNSGAMAFQRNRGVKFVNGFFPFAGGMFMEVQGGNQGFELAYNKFVINQPGPSASFDQGGIVLFYQTNNIPISTGIWVHNNDFIIEKDFNLGAGGLQGVKLINFGSGNGANQACSSGAVIEANHVINLVQPSISVSTLVFIANTKTFSTKIIGNVIDGANLVSDAGLQTKLLGNMVGGKEVSGHFSVSFGSPTVSSCGSAPNGAMVGGNDTAGTIQIGGGAITACTLTFGVPFANIPANPTCVVNDNNSSIAAEPTAISNTAVTFGFGALGGGLLFYHCDGIRE